MVTLDNNSLLFFVPILFAVIPFKARSDVGKKCHLLGICIGANIHCDRRTNTCQCNEGYPVISHAHKCLPTKRYDQKCEVPEQCSQYDPNSYCTQIPYQSYCDCLSDFKYDVKEEKCLSTLKKTEKPNLTLPLVVVIALAFSGMLCCCMVMLHLYRRRNNSLNSRNIGIFSNSGATRTQTADQPAINDNTTNLLQSPADPLPSYDVAVNLENIENQGDVIPESDCPPSYDEVMKESVKKESEVKETQT